MLILTWNVSVYINNRVMRVVKAVKWDRKPWEGRKSIEKGGRRLKIAWHEYGKR